MYQKKPSKRVHSKETRQDKTSPAQNHIFNSPALNLFVQIFLHASIKIFAQKDRVRVA